MPAWSRRRIVLAAAAAAAVVLVVVVLVVLPLVVRRVAVSQLAAITGRAVALRDVELNLFTGRVALNRFRLAQRDSADPAVEVERLEVRVAPISLLRSNVRVAELTVTRPKIYVTRLGPDRYDFSDLLALIPPPDPSKKPSTRTFTLERLRLIEGAVVARDMVPQPAGLWRLERLDVDGGGITTRRGALPGRVTLKAAINNTPLALDASAVSIAEGRVSARVTLDGFDLASVRAYLPPDLPAAPTAGRLAVDVTLTAERAADGSPNVAVSGAARVDGLAVVRRAQPDAFLTLARVDVKIKDARPLARDVTLAAVELDGLDVRARRDRAGRIDLLALAQPARAASAPTEAAEGPSGPRPGRGPGGPSAASTPTAPASLTPKITIERFALRRGTAALTDETVAPAATLALSDIAVSLEHLTWPGGTPVALDVALGLPGAGRLTVKGSATLQPFSVDVVSSLRGGSIEPYLPYIPLKARLAGSFNGDSRTRVSMAGGTLTASSQGKSWIDNLEVRRPGGGAAPIRVARMEMAGIDFGWPTHARVATVTITKPNVEVERDAAGNITLRELFAVESGDARPSPPPEAAPETEYASVRGTAPPAPPKKRISDDPRGGAVGFPVDVDAFVIDDGYVRFLDRSVQPAFSETLSRFAVRVEGLSTTPGKRARLTSQAIVGGDAALDVRGELAPLGELYADIQGELRDFTLTRVNPYASSFVAWIVDSGKLGIKFRYHIERDQVEASNEVVVENLHVQPTRKEDEVKKRIGLPLGMIVALITDGDNGLRVNLPISGPLTAWRADVSDAVWTVVRNAAVNVLAAPFRAIGRLFTGKNNTIESVGVDPVTFAAGSDVVTPEMAKHLTAVADFLRRAPAVRLTLAPLASRADLESLRAQELTARLQARQREAGLPDFAVVVAAEFARRFPGVQPPAPDEQLARLRTEEPVPEPRVAELLAHRLAAVRDGLVTGEGVPEGRLLAGEGAPPAPAEGDGRVDFRVGQ
jgi:uncharacterized protein DUF748